MHLFYFILFFFLWCIHLIYIYILQRWAVGIHKKRIATLYSNSNIFNCKVHFKASYLKTYIIDI